MTVTLSLTSKKRQYIVLGKVNKPLKHPFPPRTKAALISNKQFIKIRWITAADELPLAQPLITAGS